MNALAHQHVGEGDAGGEHPHPYFTILRLGPLFFNHAKCVGPTEASDDDAPVFQGSVLPRRARELTSRDM